MSGSGPKIGDEVTLTVVSGSHIEDSTFHSAAASILTAGKTKPMPLYPAVGVQDTPPQYLIPGAILEGNSLGGQWVNKKNSTSNAARSGPIDSVAFVNGAVVKLEPAVPGKKQLVGKFVVLPRAQV